jgi:ABC-type uncharacterized transport system permease subunit
MNLCKYKNILGKPNEGIHSVRLFNISIMDVLLTIILGILIQLFLMRVCHIYIDLFIILFILFSLGILLHRLFCVRTTIDKLLFKN